MRKTLRRRFVAICVLAYAAVALLVLAGAFIVSTVQTDAMMDELTQLVLDQGGVMPEPQRGPDRGGLPKSEAPNGDKTDAGAPREGSDRKAPNNRLVDDWMKGRFVTPETPFNTRYFVVVGSEDGSDLEVSVNSLASLSSDEMLQMAKGVIVSGAQHGWAESWYRFRVGQSEDGQVEAVFVDGFIQKSSASNSLVSTATMLLVFGVLFFVVVVLVSGRAVQPLVNAHERQKQFITDASHELKTPLTLMLTNIDIAKSESGPSDWLDDAHSEGLRMADLLSQLTKMAAMDEEAFEFNREKMDLSQMVIECADSFSAIRLQRQLELSCDVCEGASYAGDESAIRQLVSTLVDNAHRYANDGGWVRVQLVIGDQGSHSVLTVTNSISEQTEFDAERVFDRFYRADKSRTAGSGYGIGLSAARLIAEKHGLLIAAAHEPGESVSFSVRF